ncbi:LADA_0H00650g1_1 [Lachancea dasiensis]|uniref:Spindle pole body component KRE28 n=1 Tax=Lachancea dasiensis TaxID=1072105 RepID=A0A1G4JYW0_9SACH|nr:LADA_0H00650g1_1 [Lachancea dasiensis]
MARFVRPKEMSSSRRWKVVKLFIVVLSFKVMQWPFHRVLPKVLIVEEYRLLYSRCLRVVSPRFGRRRGSMDVPLLVHQLTTQLAIVEEETTTLSEQVLQDQETHYVETVEQLKQSVQQLIEDNEFLFEAVPPKVEIDLASISRHIADLSRLVDSLKSTHLEQETLDNFLRYTIPSNDLSHLLDSEQDERYVSALHSVAELRDGAMAELDIGVNQLKHEIGQTSQKIADQREVVNELCLSTGDLVDQCHTLLEELEKPSDLAGMDLDNKSESLTPEPSAEETLNALQALKENVNQRSHLKQHLGHLEQTKSLLSSIANSKDDTDQDVSLNSLNEYNSYEALIQFWKSKFVHREMQNLEIYPMSNKFQFTYRNVDCVISMSDIGISNVELYGTGIPIEKIDAARKAVNQDLTSFPHLSRQISKVLSIINEYASNL